MDWGLPQRLRNAILPACWVAVVAAPFATHLAIATGRLSGPATVLEMVEVLLFATLGLRPLRGWARAAGAVVAGLLLASLAVRLAGPGWAGTASLVAAAGASHAFIYGSLLLLFGRSLLRGRTDLVTGLATRLRGSLTPPMLSYTRNVTKAWCAFFAVQLAGSALLLAAAPHRVWSLFVNVLDGPCVVAMFAAEYAIRRWRFRGYAHISPAETFRNFARNRAEGG